MGFRDANHAYLVGNLLGALLEMCERWGGEVEPVLEDEGFTNVIRIKRQSGDYLVTVEPDFGQANSSRPAYPPAQAEVLAREASEPKDTGRRERRG